MISKNFKSFIIERGRGIALTSGISLVVGAGAVAALIISGPEIALPIASWDGAGAASRVIFLI
ncbi:MAG: hypothetical protein JSW06_07335 [Thermoplasmatales archaeon]|nr:MAG: hypothetical protein JSW06_07335 [Thermoplasmatales archaeon]